MKKVFFKSMVGVAFVGMAMSSCVEVEDLYDPEYAAKIAEYRTQWVEKFGEIDPNEDWGFGTDESSNAKALTRGVIKEDQFGNDDVNLATEDIPAAITDSELSDVLAEFNQKMENVVSESVNWSDFFVQHVSASNANYVDKAENPVVGSEKMDHLIVVKSDGTEMHANDFNAAKGGIVLMQDAGTDRFGYSNSTDSKQHYEYIVKCIKGEYYVGFDFYADGENSNQQVDRDYTYNDWIVKIVPAEYKNAKRIICEDLGTIGDFDFNDIVFDVYNDKGSAVVTLRAAGGTLPVTIGGVDVHKAFGVADDVMVNTNASNGVSVAPAIFRIPMPSTGNLNDIEVVVKAADAICVLKSPKGDAPQKICVTTDFVWPDERVSIKDVYPNFPNKDWAGNATIDQNVAGQTFDLAQYVGDGKFIPGNLFSENGAVITIEITDAVYCLYAHYGNYIAISSMNNKNMPSAGAYSFDITAEECAAIKNNGGLNITFYGRSNVVTSMKLTNK